MGTLGKIITTPTDQMPERERELNNGFRHLMPHLRLGRISGEAFARHKRLAIPVDHDIQEDRNSTAYLDEIEDEIEEPKPKVKAKRKGEEKKAVTKAKARKKPSKKEAA